MKSCPRCGKTYTDDTLNFCLDDGDLLTIHQPEPGGYIDPPTMVMDQARVTDPIHGWQQQQGGGPMAQWQQAQPQQFGGLPVSVAPNQNLAVVSLCLGIGSLTIGWCCSAGLVLGPAAIITGILARNQIKKDPSRYTGNGLALGGIITGGIYIALYVLIILIYGIAMIGGGLAGR